MGYKNDIFLIRDDIISVLSYAACIYHPFSTKNIKHKA